MAQWGNVCPQCGLRSGGAAWGAQQYKLCYRCSGGRLRRALPVQEPRQGAVCPECFVAVPVASGECQGCGWVAPRPRAAQASLLARTKVGAR